jgi:hypothetical protein
MISLIDPTSSGGNPSGIGIVLCVSLFIMCVSHNAVTFGATHTFMSGVDFTYPGHKAEQPFNL